MKITKISYSKTVESMMLGAGIWTKIGIEGEVEEGEGIVNAIEDAKATVEDAHLRNESYRVMKEKAMQNGNMTFE
jgi:hypothetical protein